MTLETEHLGGERFRATSAGFTSYAIGFQNAQAESDLSVTDVSLDSETVATGDAATVSVTVENGGDASGSITLELTAGGESVASRDVTVSAGGSQTVTFNPTFDEAGDYEIAVNGVAGGMLTVEDSTTSTATVAAPDTSTGTDTTSETIPGFGALGTIVALTIGLLVASRRE